MGDQNSRAAPTRARHAGSIIHGLAIEAMSHGADAVARENGKVVFVTAGAPGDVVDVEITKTHGRFSRGSICRLLSAATVRREPRCRYVGRCGGCQWQHLDYTAQLEAKHRNLSDHLLHIAGIADPRPMPVLASPAEWRYRNRVNLRTDGHRLGFYRAESHELVEIEECLIGATQIETALAAARRWLGTVQTKIRRLALIASESTTGVVLVANAEGLFAATDDASNRRTLTTQTDDTIRGVVMFGKRWRHSWGNVEVSFTIDGDTLKTTGGEFTQVNLRANRLLTECVLSLGAISPGDEVIDLYCGAGNLTVPVARRGARVLGIERSARATADAEANASRLGLENCRFLCRPVEKALAKLATDRARPQVVILDPPRGGSATVLADIARLGPRRVVYVSCDPPTLARDVATLARHGYCLEAVQPIDFFPHTYHLEAVASLRAS
jgi:23S rRNA (uracil1939-C5)-methyltransferase